jgi:hypothetical protein
VASRGRRWLQKGGFKRKKVASKRWLQEGGFKKVASKRWGI